MKEVNIIYCKNCGEPLNLSSAKNGVLKCKYCSTEHVLPNDDTPEEAKLYLHDGQRALDVGNFDEALTCFDKALEIDPFESESYFNKSLTKFKVQYLKDVVNNRLQPIVHELTNKKIIDDSDFKKACKIASPEKKEIYIKKANEIVDIQKSFNDLAKSNLNYDCFICVKVTDNETNGRTKDYKIADDIYFALRGKGYKPFFSEREIGSRTGTDYEAMILYALMKSECMLVVCSNEEYLNTKWVKNEYTRFLKLVNDDVKASDAITIIFDGKPIEKLPGKKGKIQGINISSLGAMESIEKYVYSHTPKAKAKAQKEKEALEAKQREALLNDIKKQFAIDENSEASLSKDKLSKMLKRCSILIESGDYAKAEKLADEILIDDPENATAYLYQLLISKKMSSVGILTSCEEPIENDSNYKNALKYASDDLKKELIEYNNKIKKNIAAKKKLTDMKQAELNSKNNATYTQAAEEERKRNYSKAIKLYTSISNFKDSKTRIDKCKEALYYMGINYMSSGSYLQAKGYFQECGVYKDAIQKVRECEQKIAAPKSSYSNTSTTYNSSKTTYSSGSTSTYASPATTYKPKEKKKNKLLTFVLLLFFFWPAGIIYGFVSLIKAIISGIKRKF